MKSKANILVVDDELIVRQSLKHWFEEDGYQVETADNGEIALKHFEEYKGFYDTTKVFN